MQFNLLKNKIKLYVIKQKVKNHKMYNVILIITP